MARFLLVVLICASVVQLNVVCGRPESSPPLSQPPEGLHGEDFEDGSNRPTAVQFRHTHSVQTGKIPGKPVSGWAYMEASVGKTNARYDLDGTSFLPKNSLWSGRMIDIATTGLYSAAVMAMIGTAYYIGAARTAEAANKQGLNLTSEKTSKNKDQVTEANGSPPGVAGDEKKARKKREADTGFVGGKTPEADAELTRLAGIVLNAIASGECLQKTVCQVGTQIGSSRNGRLALSLVDNLLPVTLHSNSYFVTMKKALKGDSNCEKFRCNNAFSY